MIVTVDLETYYSSDYSLSKMTEIDYILDPRFEFICCSVKVDDQPVQRAWGQAAIEALLRPLPWPRVALLAHNNRFDGAILAWRLGLVPALYLDTLSMARALTHSKIGRSSLAAVSKYLGLPDKGDEVVRAMGKRLADFTPEEADRYMAYCDRDTDNCKAIFDRFRQSFPTSELAVVDWNLRMFIQPQVYLNAERLAVHLHQVRADKEAAFGRLAHIDRAVFSSNQKFAALLESLGVEVPQKKSPTTGNWMPALAKNDVAFKELQADETLPPDAQAAIAIRLSAKSTIEETRTERMLGLSLREWGGGVRGVAPVPLKYYAAHCVPGETEVLTRGGWVALKDWEGGDIVQSRPDRSLTFAPAAPYRGPVVPDWVRLDSAYLGVPFTLGHTVPYLQHGTMRWATLSAGAAADRGSLYLPIGGTLDEGGTLTPEQARVLAMVQADGSWETNTKVGRGLRILLKKPRKIERARRLLLAANVLFAEKTFPSWPGYVRFVVRWADCPRWLTPERKKFGSWLFECSPTARDAIMDELIHWDGSPDSTGTTVVWSSSDPVSVDWLVTLCHLTGRAASVYWASATDNRAANAKVHVRQLDYTYVQKKQWTHDTTPREAWCAITETGFWLARYNGRIFITGNTGRFGGDGGFNWQNLQRASPLRAAVEPPPGHVILHRDASQIEARMNAFLAGCTKLLRAFERGEDIYSQFASIVYGVQVTKADKTRRFVGKTSILGLGYGMGPQRFKVTLFLGSGGISMVVSEDEAHAIVKTYRATYAEIPYLWDRAEAMLFQMVQQSLPYDGSETQRRLMERTALAYEKTIPAIEFTANEIWLPNNLFIPYPNLRIEPADPNTGAGGGFVYDGPRGEARHLFGGKVVENLCQALSRIVITDIARRVKAEAGIWPWLSTHDSLDYCVPHQNAAEFDAYLDRQFAIRPYWAPTLPLASEGGWGFTLADAEKGANPPWTHSMTSAA